MIIKRIASDQKRRSAETNKYIVDVEHDGEKLVFSGMINCFSENIDDAQVEMHNDELAYNGDGDAVSHWMFSLRDDENITQEQTIEFIQEFLKDQGMEDHKVIYALHDNTNNLHCHLTVMRVKPQAEENGSYKIQNFGGREKWKNGTTNEFMSARATTIDFCNKYNMKHDFDEVHAERDKDAIKLSQKIEAQEAQTMQKHPKRLIAEKARDIIRSSNDIQSELNKNGMRIEIKEGEKNGKKWRGGVIVGPNNEKIPLSCLPKDCSLKNIEHKFSNKQTIEAVQVNTSMSSSFYKDNMTANRAKSVARKLINSASSMSDVETKLAAQGMRLERQGKSGCYLVYGEDAAQKMKLSALGGKYSLHALSKKFNESINKNSSPYASNMHESQKNVNGKAAPAAARLEHAQERAAAQAAETGTAQTLSEALEEGFAQAQTLDQLRKATAAAAAAEARAAQAENKLKEAEQKKMEHRPEPPRPGTSSYNDVSATKNVNATVSTSEQQNTLRIEAEKKAAREQRIIEARQRAQRAATTAAPVGTIVQNNVTTTTNNLTHRQ